jgi:predicted ArsR family transcriptional regulator
VGLVNGQWQGVSVSLQHRIMIVLRGSEEPLSSPQVARILGLTAQSVSSPLSKLCAYGKVEYVRTETAKGRRGACLARFYRPKEIA